MPTRRAALAARTDKAIAALLAVPVNFAIAALLCLAVAPGAAGAQESAASPRLIEVDLGSTMPLTALLEAGLGVYLARLWSSVVGAAGTASRRFVVLN